jgi:hypothetical protein
MRTRTQFLAGILIGLVLAVSFNAAASAITRRFQGVTAIDKLVVGADSDGLLLGSGTTSAKATTATADKNFWDNRFESTATSGDSRGIYNKLFLNGTGVSGESLRSYTEVDKAVANAHGAHLTLAFGVSPAAITGQGAAGRLTLMIPNRATMSGGTYYGGLSEVWMDGTSASAAPLTQVAVHAFLVNGGDATAEKTVKNAFAIGYQADGSGTGNMIYAHTRTAGDAQGTIRILICNNGTCTPKYLAYYDAE